MSIDWVQMKTPEQVAAERLAEAKKGALQRLKLAAQAAAEQYIKYYPDFETKTWVTQEAEARAWLLDHTAPTPTLDGIATVRGIPLEELVDKVIKNADAFHAHTRYLMGVRQLLNDQIDTATTLEAVAAIQWPEELTPTDG